MFQNSNRRVFIYLVLAASIAPFTAVAQAGDQWSSWISTDAGKLDYRWRSVYYPYGPDSKQIQFRNRGDAGVSFAWKAYSDNDSAAGGVANTLASGAVSDQKVFQLKGSLTNVSITMR